jgi:hypothetical protein
MIMSELSLRLISDHEATSLVFGLRATGPFFSQRPFFGVVSSLSDFLYNKDVLSEAWGEHHTDKSREILIGDHWEDRTDESGGTSDIFV